MPGLLLMKIKKEKKKSSSLAFIMHFKRKKNLSHSNSWRYSLFCHIDVLIWRSIAVGEFKYSVTDEIVFINSY